MPASAEINRYRSASKSIVLERVSWDWSPIDLRLHPGNIIILLGHRVAQTNILCKWPFGEPQKHAELGLPDPKSKLLQDQCQRCHHLGLRQMHGLSLATATRGHKTRRLLSRQHRAAPVRHWRFEKPPPSFLRSRSRLTEERRSGSIAEFDQMYEERYGAYARDHQSRFLWL